MARKHKEGNRSENYYDRQQERQKDKRGKRKRRIEEKRRELVRKEEY